MNGTFFIWLAVIGALVAVLWRTGQLMRLSNYVQETREELKKCTWPTWAELRGSTVVVIISVALLGGFTVAVDFVFANIIHLVT